MINDPGVHARMRGLMATIQQAYDFSTFTWESFVAWLSTFLGKQVHCAPLPIEAGTLFGGWISTQQAEYIFYDGSTLPMHQLHIQLHEIAHILCGHTTFCMDVERLPEDRAELLRMVTAAVRLRHVAEAEPEQEAEVLTALIQQAVFRHGRQEALLTFDFQNRDEEVLVGMMELG